MNMELLLKMEKLGLINFTKAVNGKLAIPDYGTWEADRLLLYKDEIVAAVDVKSKASAIRKLGSVK